MKITLNFIEPLLGSLPGNKTTASDFIRDKMVKEMEKTGQDTTEFNKELETLPEALEKGTTVFHRDSFGKPFVYNYQIKGLLKEAAEKMNGLDGFKNLRSKMQSYVYVSPRRIPITFEGDITIFERPLRGMTMQGPRISLARSEMIPAGAKISFEVKIIEPPSEKMRISKELFLKIFEFGQNLGFLQFRNSGIYGAFDYKVED